MSEKKRVLLAVTAKDIQRHNEANGINLKEEFKGEVINKDVRFPKDLGVAHPYDFKEADKIWANVGLVNAGVNKTVDAIIGDFTVQVDDVNAQAIIDKFIEASDFTTHIRPWVHEGVLKGNGYMDLTDLQNDKITTRNANRMYIKRNKKGKIKKYNQFNGHFSTFTKNSKVVEFEPNQIAHLPVNAMPEAAYGLGMVWPNRASINNYVGNEVSLHKVIDRKANSPYHFKVGVPGQAAQPGDVQEIANSMQYMDNSTEWVTDANVEIKPLEMTSLGDSLTETSKHDIEQIAMGMQIPMVLMGVANIPEGLAKVQDKAHLRFIHSVRILIEDIIETKIFGPLLEQNDMAQDVSFIWELPGDEEKEKRLTVIGDQLKNPMISPELKAELEREYARVMGFDDLVEQLVKPEDAEAKQEEQRKKEEEEIKQPEVPGAKPTAQAKAEIKILEAIAGITNKVNDHHHTFATDNAGNGQTRRTEPFKETPAHTHLIEENKILEADNHTHKMVNTEEKAITEVAHSELTESQAQGMNVGQYVNLTMIEGFSYPDYLVKILMNLRTEKFADLLAITERDLAEGLLPDTDIKKLRVVLKDGFRKNKTIRQIEKDIQNSIDLKDRVKFDENGEGKVTLTAAKRPINIARTETVRLANQGLKDLYAENKIEKYQYLAAIDERTSDICQSLNGQVFFTKDGIPGTNMPPMHPMCRSTIKGLIE